MLFNSFQFIFIFLPASLVLFFTSGRLGRYTFAKIILILSSLFFYAYWDYRYLALLLFSLTTNYLIGKRLSINSNKWLLSIGIIFNLSILGYYKYADFFLSNINVLFGSSFSLLKIILPLGISFITFQKIAFLIDSYKKTVHSYNFLNFSLFVTFFPQLIAGPIVHHKDIMPQFAETKNFVINYHNIAQGIFFFTIGLFKKVIVADNLIAWATPGFETMHQLGFFEAWGTALSYTFQLYFDFSGYSEMAIGLALLFNIKLPINFNSPYQANNIIDFWKRWHMTLSTFLKDYVYIALGGNRKGKLRRHLNLLLTMLIGGLWHGAGWTFVIWGGLHGGFLIINHAFRAAVKRWIPFPSLESSTQVAASSSMPLIIRNVISFLTNMPSRAITLGCVVIAWVFFRSNDLEHAKNMLKGMMNVHSINFTKSAFLPGGPFQIIVLILLFLWVSIIPNTTEVSKKLHFNWVIVITLSFIFVLSLLSLNKISSFLYFQF